MRSCRLMQRALALCDAFPRCRHYRGQPTPLPAAHRSLANAPRSGVLSHSPPAPSRVTGICLSALGGLPTAASPEGQLRRYRGLCLPTAAFPFRVTRGISGAVLTATIPRPSEAIGVVGWCSRTANDFFGKSVNLLRVLEPCARVAFYACTAGGRRTHRPAAIAIN